MSFGAIAYSNRGEPLRPPPIGDRVKNLENSTFSKVTQFMRFTKRI